MDRGQGGNDGVSVVICCFNSALRLAPTLQHLRAQRVPSHIPWEVLLIDNGSTDGTIQVAKELWNTDVPATLRIEREPTRGLSKARSAGLRAARHDFVSFIDDDNWVAPDWVQTVWRTLTEHPDAGACGSCNDVVCEVPPPPWFERHRRHYAVGSQGDATGDVTWTRGYLWGAGLSLRRQAWRQLVDAGFQNVLQDRRGTALASGGDSELCAALRLAGWRLWYEPHLRLQHFLPAPRLTWPYLRALHRGFGAASIALRPYALAALPPPDAEGERGPDYTWRGMASARIRGLRRYGSRLLEARVRSLEGVDDVLDIEWKTGELRELLRMRSAYDRSIDAIRDAPWRTTGDPHAEVRHACRVRAEYNPDDRTFLVRVNTAESDIRFVELFLNDVPDTPAAGTWLQLGTAAGTGRGAEARFQIPQGQIAPGIYRVGVNVHLDDAQVLYWYEQPLRTVRIR